MVKEFANDFLDAGVLNIEVGDGQLREEVATRFCNVCSGDTQSCGEAGVFDDGCFGKVGACHVPAEGEVDLFVGGEPVDDGGERAVVE
ncbi:MAG: hypothetical protein RIS92_2722 [Verrucomicrobiota bacterium]